MVASGSWGVNTRNLAWKVSETPPSLQAGQIQIWFLDVSRILNGNNVQSSRCGLSHREIARAGRIVDHAKRQLYLAGRAGLRYLLQRYTGIEAASISFQYGERGNPSIDCATGAGNLHFNYTVSGGYALYAFSAGVELGVDLEIFPRKIHGEGFARRILSTVESESWKNVPHKHRDNAMLACWTRKEAYGKLLGVGIHYNMNQVTLFTDLRCDSWCTGVSGLFDDEKPVDVSEVCGVQLQLPVPGAAALMYCRPGSAVNGQGARSKIGPELLAFQLQPARDNA